MPLQNSEMNESKRLCPSPSRKQEVDTTEKCIASDRCAVLRQLDGRKLRKYPFKRRSDDLEKACAAKISHVRIKISGMTCTCCFNKGLNALNRISGVANAKINFVAGRGEFDLDSQSDLTTIISHFEDQTGFKCSLITEDFQSLLIVMSDCEAKQLEDRAFIGIQLISKVDNETYSVTYDPLLLGARSLLALIPSSTLATPKDNDSFAGDKKRLCKMAWSTAFAAAFTIPVVVLAWSNNSFPYSRRSVISIILASCVQAIAIPEFYIGAFKSLIFSKVIEMDMLVVISVTAAYGYSVVAFILVHRGFTLEQGAFFETSTLLVTLILVGRLVSAIARVRALTAVSMKSLQAETALLIDDSGGNSKLDARLLEHGDNVTIPPYARVVTDGQITSGSSIIDESTITGESVGVSKRPGDTVIAGTMNGPSSLNIRLTRLPGQNSITDIASLVENALGAKPHVQVLAEKIASWFVPVVVGISSIVFALWVGVALKIRNENVGGSLGLAITYAIAVLAVSCPCALGLAVPMVLIIAGGVSARSGVVIKSAFVTERAHRTTDVVFDKTGTLTTGVLKVAEEEYHGTTLQLPEVKSLIFALLRDNNHPVSCAVAKSLQDEASTSVQLKDVQSVPGAGLNAMWEGKHMKAGNPYWLKVDSHPEIHRLMEGGMTMVAVTIDSELVATYGLTSTLRPETSAVIENLHQRKIACHIVSGDGSKVVEAAAQKVGIKPHNTASRQTPSSKQQYVKNLIDQGKTVLFCGDGTNDAVAVAQAHIGVQIGSTSDITRATADVVLTGGLDGIPALLDISRQAYIRIVFNFVWSAFYNLFAILLAAGAFVKIRIPPAYAGLGEIVSVLPIILVALSLMGFKRKAL